MRRAKPTVVLTLRGKDGLDRFAVLTSCRLAARKAGWTRDEITRFCVRAISGDHNDMIRVCCEHFDFQHHGSTRHLAD